jgi:ABC-type transport system involved in cytochrome c biogenesis permease component
MNLILLFRKELLFEWRSMFQLGGLFSFLIGVSYLVYFFSGELSSRLWNLMYWIIYLFLAFFTASRCYEEDNGRYKIFSYQLSSALDLFMAKVSYLFIILFLFGFLLNAVFNVLIPHVYSFTLSWFLIVAIVSFGFALLTAFTSFIASHGQVKQIVMVIISLPLCFPLLGMGFSLSLEVLAGNPISDLYSRFYPLVAIDLLALALVTFLLPLTWKN